MRGGYKMIDLQDVNLTNNDSYIIKGIYDSIESNYRKPLLLTGLIVDSIEKTDRYVTFTHSGSAYTSTIETGLTVTITDGDTVILTQEG